MLILIGLSVTGCIHKMDIQQGNVFTESEVSRLHPGMNEAQVKAVMGNPVLVNVFTTNEVAYVYTNKPGREEMTMRKVVCVFQYGTLREIRRS
jgi:outer membrane protein assembly factor BamE